MSNDLSPPWVLFSDRGRPIAILPAGRAGEVANVSHLSMKDATRLVNSANELYRLIAAAKLSALESKLNEMIHALHHCLQAGDAGK